MYTVWTNTMTVAYKTRRGLTGGTDEYVEETAYWFEPQPITAGLTAEQARSVVAALERATEVSPIAGARRKDATAHRLALKRKEDVVLHYFWVTLDGVTPEVAGDAPDALVAS